MGRPPIRKQAMTAAERQRRRRKKLRRERNDELKKKYRAIARDKQAENYMPYPPGVYYWKNETFLTLEGERVEIARPHVRPLAACHDDLEDDDVLALLDELHGIAQQRGLDLSTVPPYPVHTHHPAPDEASTIGALPRASRAESSLAELAAQLEAATTRR